MAKYILAHDFGTSGDKASLFTTEGKFVGTRTVGYPTHYQHGTWAEQDPMDWWNAFCESTRSLLADVDAKDVLCVAFSGTYPNCLCVDKEGEPLHDAMIWQDARSYEEAKEISALLPPVYTKGRPNGILATDRTLPKLLWVKKHLPEVFAKTHKVFPSVADFIVMKLTGNAVVNERIASSTAMMNPEKTGWSDEVLSIAGIPRSMMPDLKARTDVVGETDGRYAQACGLAAGTKLVIGTGDTICTAIGAGVLKPGDAFMNGGTSAGIYVEPKPGDGSVGGLTASSGSSLSWLKNNICKYEQELARQTGRDVYAIINEEVAKAPIGSNGVLFHPYLAGERAPRNNPRAKGSFVGISLTTTREDILRSVIEGIGFNINVILQSVRDKGYDIQRLAIVGGLGKGEVTRQIFADIMNIELMTFQYMDETATVGAAVLGGIAIGLYEDESAVHKFMEISAVTKPDPARHAQYERIMPLFEAVYQAQVPLYEQM